MSFSGKATYSAGDNLPEIAEDVTDLVSINSPHETPLLDAIGDAPRPARSTVHEWLEDSLLPNTDSIATISSATSFIMDNAAVFRTGDLVRFDGASEVALVTGVDNGTSTLTLVRGYGGTTQATLAAGQTAMVIGNASLEGADADAARFGARTRVQNYTQIFASTVTVSGSELAVNQIGVRDEMAWQKNLRSRELLRDLENSVINGVATSDTPAGNATTRRTMNGLLSFLHTNQFAVGQNGFPADVALTEAQLNLALRSVWKNSAGTIDLIVVGGREKRAINQFVAANRRFYSVNETFKDMVSVYESDFGICQVVLSRYVPSGTVLLLDSSRLSVLPLAGRSFQYTPLARTGDAETGQMIGEYTLECRNETAHGVIRGFTA
ncbi:MAG: SU10 major capsid protein [Tepidisphaeraceae bacterium]